MNNRKPKTSQTVKAIKGIFSLSNPPPAPLQSNCSHPSWSSLGLLVLWWIMHECRHQLSPFCDKACGWGGRKRVSL